MTQIDPTPPDFHPDEDLLLKVAEALGFDLEKIDAGDEDCGGRCPCCALDAVMDLILAEKDEAYRKGWDHVVDGSTPPVPDLLFGAQLDAKTLDDIAKQKPFCDDNGKLLKSKE